MLAHILVSPSDGPAVYAVIAIVFCFGVFARSWTVAVLGACSAPAIAPSRSPRSLLKPAFGRTFPRGGLSYPSGHTVSSVAALTVALLVGLTLLRTRRGRIIAWAVYAVLVVMLTIGLVAMRYHYLTDIFGGYGMALGIVLPIAVVLSRWSRARSRSASRDSATSRDTARRYFFR